MKCYSFVRVGTFFLVDVSPLCGTDRFFGLADTYIYDIINHTKRRVMRASEVDNRWEMGGWGGSRTTQSCLLKGTGRYPHLSNATEKDLSGPPRAGRKGFRSELCIGFGSVAATHTHAAERSNTKSVTLLAPSVIAIQHLRFFPFLDPY